MKPKTLATILLASSPALAEEPKSLVRLSGVYGTVWEQDGIQSFEDIREYFEAKNTSSLFAPGTNFTFTYRLSDSLPFDFGVSTTILGDTLNLDGPVIGLRNRHNTGGLYLNLGQEVIDLNDPILENYVRPIEIGATYSSTIRNLPFGPYLHMGTILPNEDDPMKFTLQTGITTTIPLGK